MSEVSERLRRRYPPARLPRPALVAIIGVGVLVALSWLVWTALVHSRPAVAGSVVAYAVRSDTSITVTVAVDRRDPNRPATCRLIAQAEDFQTVGELPVAVPSSRFRTQNVPVTVTTLRRATSATIRGCTLT